MSFLRVLRNAEHAARAAVPVLNAAGELVSASRNLGGSFSRRSPREQFRQSHGGNEPADRMWVDTASTTVELVELGELDSIAYWADKGNGMERWIHDFGPERIGGTVPRHALPILCFASDGTGLVIARGQSAYTVTPHGIEG